VRGASALDKMLRHQGDKKVAVLIVWERVGRSRAAPAATKPPPSSVLSRISDIRVAQFWDGGQLTSSALRDAAQKHPGWPTGELVSNGGVIWDTVLIFAPGGRWDHEPPVPAYAGGDVVDVIEEVEKRL
jgi:hypothetical protein